VEVRWEEVDEEVGLVGVELAADGTRWVGGGRYEVGGGTASPLIVTTDPPEPRSSVGTPPCSETGSNSEPIERCRLPLLETPLEDWTESLLRHFPASRPVLPRACPSSFPGMLEFAWFQDSLLWMDVSLPSAFRRSSIVPAVWYLRVSGPPALPWPLLFLPSSPTTASTSAGSEMTVI